MKICFGAPVVLPVMSSGRQSASPAPYRAEYPGRSRGVVDPEQGRRLLAMLDNAVNALGVPGLQAAVRFADGSHWTGVSGTADMGRLIPLPLNAAFRTGSLTKFVTAALLLKLVDEGYLSLDDTLNRWFPRNPNAGHITVRHLLSHRSGIPEILGSIWVKLKSSFTGHVWKPGQLAKIAKGLSPYGNPGGAFSYSNTNYILLGLIAEKVTGYTFTQLLRNRIAAPLRLDFTCLVPFDPPPGTLVTGYDRDTMPFPGLYRTTPTDTSWASLAFTSGALVSTAEELARFTEALFGGLILSNSALQSMLAFHESSIVGVPAQRGYGLGIQLLDLNGLEHWGHIGQFIGSTAIAVHAPARNFTAAVAGNLSVFDVASLVVDLERACW